jgi:hypothetical protein
MPSLPKNYYYNTRAGQMINFVQPGPGFDKCINPIKKEPIYPHKPSLLLKENRG